MKGNRMSSNDMPPSNLSSILLQNSNSKFTSNESEKRGWWWVDKDTNYA